MIRSQQEEKELMDRFEKLIWYVAHHFKRRVRNSKDNLQDLFQEGAIVVLQHIRSCDTEEELKRISVRDIVNAMCRYIMKDQVISIPSRTSDMKSISSKVGETISFGSQLDNLSFVVDSCVETVISEMDFQNFKAELSDEERKVVDYRLKGYQKQEIADILGVCNARVTRTLKKVRVLYKNYYGSAA